MAYGGQGFLSSVTMKKGTIFEEREALMVSPEGRIPTLRTAYFLNPTVSSINGPNLKLPSLPLYSECAWPISVSFSGWYDPLEKWSTWVDSMLAKNQYIWKMSGIYDAIVASTYRIRKNPELIFGVAERWFPDTNSFFFPWAEATITLEDMMILGGFSVLGKPFSMPKEFGGFVEIKDGLNAIIKSKGRVVSHCEWMDYFMGSGNDLERYAFLSLWLSRFVLPGNILNAINEDNFSIAIYLARGIRIALAPVVLANLYRDLTLIKEAIVDSRKLDVDDSENKHLALSLLSPLQFVQIWAWERLPTLQPQPKAIIYLGQPRLARWHDVNWLNLENIRLVIDSAEESFMWRPYTIAVDKWLYSEFYEDKEQKITSDMNLTEKLESFARCLRVSELIGTHSIEVYLPHRVARQFGMDQDLPRWVPKSNATPEIAWKEYVRAFSDEKLYRPCRLFEADVTTQYLDWWEKSVLNLQGEIRGLHRRKRSSRKGAPSGFSRKYIGNL